MKKRRPSQSKMFLYTVAFRAIMDLSYIYFVSPLFFYQGFQLDFSLKVYIVSWILFILSVLPIKSRLRRPSDLVFLIFSLGLLVPLTSYAGLSGRGFTPVFSSLAAFYVSYVIVNLPADRLKMPYIPLGLPIAVFGSIMLSIFLVFWYFISGAVTNFNLSLANVYEFREISDEVANIGLLAYLNSWIMNVSNIFCIAFFLFRRKYFLVILFTVVQVFFFSVSAHKSVLFYPLLVLCVWAYLKKSDDLTVVVKLLVLVVSISTLLNVFFDNIFVPSLFVRRVFFTSAILTYDYFDFFNQESPRFLMWSQSILSGYFVYPFDESISKVIGDYNGTGASANNGFISSGYANAGYYGIIFYSILFGFLVKIIDIVTLERIPVWFALAITIVPLRNAIISSDLFTTLLTHGLGVAVLLLLVASVGMPADRKMAS